MAVRALILIALALPNVAFGAFPSCVYEFLRNALVGAPAVVPVVEPEPKPPAVARVELLEFLDAGPGQERKLVHYLRRTRWLRELFDNDGGAVYHHTQAVMAECANRWSHLDWSALVIPEGFALAATVKVALALHDIGKGTKNYWRIVRDKTQHDFTIPLLQKAMAELGFSADEIALATALVGHDHVGQMIQRRLPVDAAYDALLQRQKTTVLSPKDFFRVQTFFYIADVTSYSQWREEVLDRGGRSLVSPQFRALAEKF